MSPSFNVNYSCNVKDSLANNDFNNLVNITLIKIKWHLLMHALNAATDQKHALAKFKFELINKVSCCSLEKECHFEWYCLGLVFTYVNVMIKDVGAWSKNLVVVTSQFLVHYWKISYILEIMEWIPKRLYIGVHTAERRH